MSKRSENIHSTTIKKSGELLATTMLTTGLALQFQKFLKVDGQTKNGVNPVVQTVILGQLLINTKKYFKGLKFAFSTKQKGCLDT